LAAVVWHPVQGQSSPSLGEARLGVIKGNSPGITLIGRSAASAPVAAASGASQAASSAKFPVQSQARAAPSSGTSNAPATATGGGWGSLLRALPPPQGEGMSSAKRLDSPSLGIALPSAASSAPAKADSPAPSPSPGR
jgi:hypothetical protein